LLSSKFRELLREIRQLKTKRLTLTGGAAEMMDGVINNYSSFLTDIRSRYWPVPE